MSTFRFQLAVSLDGAGSLPWRVVRRQPSVPHAGLRAHPPSTPAPGDGGRDTFVFVTEGIEATFEQARQAAGGRDVLLGGDAGVVQQYLAAGLVDEFELHLVPVLLGAGARLLEHIGDLNLEQARAIEAPGVTHITYRVVKSG
jgi:dihydrofolate reductase